MAMAADLSARLGLIAPRMPARIARIVGAAACRCGAAARRRALCRADAHGQESRSRPDPFHRVSQGPGQAAVAGADAAVVAATIEAFAAEHARL
jgi:hypothetical protein